MDLRGGKEGVYKRVAGMVGKKKSKQNKRANLNRIALLGLALVALLTFFGYRFWQQQRVVQYLEKVEEIQNETSSKIKRLNQDFVQFRGDVKSANYVLPKFKKGKKVLEEANTKLEQLSCPEEAKDLRQSLLRLYEESAALCSDLASVAQYVVDRTEILAELAKDVQTFDKSIKKAKTDEEAIAAAESLKKSAGEALNYIEKLSKPDVFPYSNQVLASYLAALAQASDLLGTGIERKDLSMVNQAVKELNKVFSQDWVKAQFVEDKQGMENYRQRIREIETLRQQVVREQQSLRQKMTGR